MQPTPDLEPQTTAQALTELLSLISKPRQTNSVVSQILLSNK